MHIYICIYVHIYDVATAYSLLFGAKFYALRYVRIKWICLRVLCFAFLFFFFMFEKYLRNLETELLYICELKHV